MEKIELYIITAFRGMERLTIVLGAIYLMLLGYKLYELGIKEGPTKAEFNSSFMKFAISGVGPGIGFMFGGVLIMSIALFMPAGTSSVKYVPFNMEKHPSLDGGASSNTTSPNIKALPHGEKGTH